MRHALGPRLSSHRRDRAPAPSFAADSWPIAHKTVLPSGLLLSTQPPAGPAPAYCPHPCDAGLPFLKQRYSRISDASDTRRAAARKAWFRCAAARPISRAATAPSPVWSPMLCYNAPKTPPCAGAPRPFAPRPARCRLAFLLHSIPRQRRPCRKLSLTLALGTHKARGQSRSARPRRCGSPNRRTPLAHQQNCSTPARAVGRTLPASRVAR